MFIGWRYFDGRFLGEQISRTAKPTSFEVLLDIAVENDTVVLTHANVPGHTLSVTPSI